MNVVQFNPWHNRHDAVERLLDARSRGATLRAAAAAAGVHVSTACRWAARCVLFREALAYAKNDAEMDACWAALAKPLPRPPRRPRVASRAECPRCGRRLQVRTT